VLRAVKVQLTTEMELSQMLESCSSQLPRFYINFQEHFRTAYTFIENMSQNKAREFPVQLEEIRD
jgi:hypothetical protein